MSINKKLAIITYTGWCVLGCKRGINHYNYNHPKKEEYFYSVAICNGFLGSLLYANPFLFPYFISKEIYRLEVVVRNLEKEKKKDYYNDII